MPKIPVKNLSIEGTLSVATGGSIQIGSAALSETQLQQVVNGADGAQGAAGADGAQGIQGVAGADGAQGIQGPSGADGAQGIQGAAGADGAQGIQGPSGGVDGVDGVAGPQGIQGPAGPSGGVDGADGAQGIQGVQGPIYSVPQVPTGWHYADPNDINNTGYIEGTSGQLYYGFNALDDTPTSYQSLLYMWFEYPDGEKKWKSLNFQNPSA